jgi:hypothetical protein
MLSSSPSLSITAIVVVRRNSLTVVDNTLIFTQDYLRRSLHPRAYDIALGHVEPTDAAGQIGTLRQCS